MDSQEQEFKHLQKSFFSAMAPQVPRSGLGLGFMRMVPSPRMAQQCATQLCQWGMGGV